MILSLLIVPALHVTLIGALGGLVGAFAYLARRIFFAASVPPGTFPGAGGGRGGPGAAPRAPQQWGRVAGAQPREPPAPRARPWPRPRPGLPTRLIQTPCARHLRHKENGGQPCRPPPEAFLTAGRRRGLVA